ncbi:C-terminal helicase domain-containing protein [Thermoflavifilum sp.]|uniref:C-terminal helicase domain-containing protein n=1 Tax=Thermoflavifilum sp. TaxID=1968839 RepID=UPI0025D3BDE2|nr:C-terminal helicase domain-containing protein [Thermoflavifilum sp.]
MPIGTQDAAMLDTAVSDADEEFAVAEEDIAAPLDESAAESAAAGAAQDPLAAFKARAAAVYETYAQQYRDRFDWLAAKFFRPQLQHALEADAQALLGILARIGTWDPKRDTKLEELTSLLTTQHARDKVLIFTQFADTAQYLKRELSRRVVRDLEVVTNQTGDPVALARRFSPSSNGGLRAGEQELRILIATDVLAEGQNLQDAHIIVNYDLPWAIIRLIQRAGRVDRIGQQHDTILVYSFLPADGVERIIQLRQRLFWRLQQNQEVIGTDETFFGEEAAAKLRDLYTEKAGTLDDDPSDEDIDLASLALQVWKSASAADQKEAVALPPIVSATRAVPETADPAQHPPGVITYLRYPDGTDALVRVDQRGVLVSQSISAIFGAAACAPDEPPLERAANHHELVARCVELATEEQTALGGQLGSLRSVRRKLYEQLKRYREQLLSKPTLFARETLEQLDGVLDLLWKFPLRRTAQDAISRQMRLGITDEALLELVLRRAADENLCEVTAEETQAPAEPRIICSMGLVWSVNPAAKNG